MFTADTASTAPRSVFDELTRVFELAVEMERGGDGDALADTVIRVGEIVDRLGVTLAGLVAEADRRGVHRGDGYTSMTSFLAHKARMRAGRAKRLVADGRALQEMPETVDRLKAGRLSVDEVRPLIAAKQAHPDEFADHETGLCDAVETTRWVKDATKVVDYWRQAVSDPGDDRRSYDERVFHGSFILDGMFDFSGRMPGEMGRQFLDRIESVMEPPAPMTIASPLNGDSMPCSMS